MVDFTMRFDSLENQLSELKQDKTELIEMLQKSKLRMPKDYKRHNRSAIFDDCQSACQSLLSNTQRKNSISSTSSLDEKTKQDKQQCNDKREISAASPVP